jgi:hypothetical protein
MQNFYTTGSASTKNIRRYENDDFELDEDFEDFYDEVITGRQNMSGEDSGWEITKNMTPELLSLFGVTDARSSAKEASKNIVWQAPSTSGLRNSEPIIRTAFNSASSARGSSQNSTNSNKINGEQFISGNYDEDDEEDDYDEEEEEKDLVKYYSDAVTESLSEFINEVVTGKQNLNGDDSSWKITKNMSPSLLALFDMDSRAPVSSTLAWQAPAKSGLGNSEPILRTAFNTAAATEKRSNSTAVSPAHPPAAENTGVPPAGRFRRNYQFNPEEGVVKRTGTNNNPTYNSDNNSGSGSGSGGSVLRESVQTQSVTTIETLVKDVDDNDFNDDEDEEDEEEEEEDEEDSMGDLEEEDEDAYANRILAMMSNNLKVAAGVRVSDAPLATDWTPPSHPGLQNSGRLIR